MKKQHVEGNRSEDAEKKEQLRKHVDINKNKYWWKGCGKGLEKWQQNNLWVYEPAIKNREKKKQ